MRPQNGGRKSCPCRWALEVPLLEIGWIVGVLALLYAIYLHVRSRRRDAIPQRLQQAAPAPSGPLALYYIVNDLSGFYQMTAQPEHLALVPEFERGVQHLSDPTYSPQDLIRFASGDNAVIACMALEALYRRPDPGPVADGILGFIHDVVPWSRYYALRVLEKHVPPTEPLLGRILPRLEDWRNRMMHQFLRDFVVARLEAGEEVEFDAEWNRLDEFDERLLLELLRAARNDKATALAQRIETRHGEVRDVAARPEMPKQPTAPPRGLDGLGRFSSPESLRRDPVIEHVALEVHLEALETILAQPSPRSVILVGEMGVGKTALVRALAGRLLERGWTVFEAGDADIIAGQRYMGDFEQRVMQLLQAMESRQRFLWYIPNFHQILWTGRHDFQPRGLLDILLPYLEQRKILVLGETRSDAFERLTQAQPRCPLAMDVLRLEPLSMRETLDLARGWARHHAPEGAADLAPESTLREAANLVQQYLTHQAAPGNLLSLLELTRKRLAHAAPAPARPLTSSDFLATLSQLTGLPESILDERTSLDLQALRALFDKRILGQPEAVECLVERVAMIKAGVTDPTRPQGVFLFAGPTGTGKTEIAKTLAEFLFGSPERMIRLDMSEMQTHESLDRLLGSTKGGSGALVDQVREQPFSVVLLDEFEKAHPNVWDLFLQVFDDGRLTDRRGNTADFRHAIVIMTSNLGGVIPSGTSLGFAPGSTRYRPEQVRRAVGEAFRREFLNRIDRIVVFQPLGTETMRRILRKELDDVMRRRGLRNRDWAVEWGEDALDFLLAKGFTADLGARPLKRAIERYVLAPLAKTIVTHQYPKGDQFLFVRAEGDALEVQFVDPDAPAEPAPPASTPEAGLLRLEQVALEPRGTAREIAVLQSHYDRIRDLVEAGSWQAAKRDLMQRMAEPEFWQSETRFRLLGDAEYLDRIENGVRGAGSLLERLLGGRSQSREHYPRDLVGRLAERLYLLDAACAGVAAQAPRDAFLLVESGEAGAEADAFASRLGGMYHAWARKRRMDVRVLEGDLATNGTPPYRLLLAVSGFAAFVLLQAETGLHVLEVPETSGGITRHRVRVRAVPQPDAPAGPDPDALRRQAQLALQAEARANPVVVRRYRESPPLVRDSVRGWRTGRLDRVLAGDFDLLAACRSED